MDAAKSLIPSELIDFLLNVAPIRPVFIWGPPGIGKSSLVEALRRFRWLALRLFTRFATGTRRPDWGAANY